jgi:hypothetical protein
VTAREHPSEAQAAADCPCRTWAGLDLADWPEGGHHRLCDGHGGRRYTTLRRRTEPYRVGNHNPRNIYRSGVDRDTDEQVAVAFAPEMGRLIVVALNALVGGSDA